MERKRASRAASKPTKELAVELGSTAAPELVIADHGSNTVARAKALLRDRNRLLVAIGWQLSPFTEYNDPVVNIPLAWLLARLLKALLGWNLKQTFLPCYWFTNGLGILLLVVGLTRSGLKLVIKREEIVRLVLVTAAFSLILFLISRLF